ncbi:MAG: sucrase ferredoxin [Cyanobacteria bacterium P01_D01_bin.156]
MAAHHSLATSVSTDSPCRYCSVASKANQEDPIGSAVVADQWMFIEVPQPWAKNPWQDQLSELQEVFQQIERKPKLWKRLRIVAIAPDKHHSTPDRCHIFFYRKPRGPVADYTQQHYWVPRQKIANLVQSLTLQPAQIETFSAYQQPFTRNLFVCTHTHYDVACGRFGTPLYRTLRERYAQDGQLQIWQTSHFGGHNFAPTLIDFPMGQFWGHLEPDALDSLVYRRGDISELRLFYRGWTGFSHWEQVAERDLWMQQGWSWLHKPKLARVIRRDPGKFIHQFLRWVLPWIPHIRAQILLKKLERKLTWADVEISWHERAIIKTYRVRVEVSHSVLSQMKSGTDQPLVPVQQYSVKAIPI